MDENEEVDIYGSLPDYDFDKKMQELEGTNRNLKKRVKELEGSVESLSNENEKLSKRGRSLDRNISALYATALAELEAKNRMIEDLKREKDSILFRRQTKDNNTSQQNEEQPSQIKEFISSNVRPSRSEGSSKDSINPDRSREVKRIDQSREDSKRRDKSREDMRRNNSSRDIRKRDRSREVRKDGSREQARKDESRDDLPREDSRGAGFRERPREDGPRKEIRKDGPRKEIRKDGPREEIRIDEPREEIRIEGSKEDLNRDRSLGSQHNSRIDRQRGNKPEDKTNKSSRSSARRNEVKTKHDNFINKTVQEKSSSETTKPGDVNFQCASVSVEKATINEVSSVLEVSEPAQKKIAEPVVLSLDDDNQDTSTESNASSTKENSQESKLVRAERLHQKKFAKKKAPEISLKKEIKKISPLKKTSSSQKLDQSSSTVEDDDGKYNDLLSSLLTSEKNRINKSSRKKKFKKSVSIEISPKNSPATPGKFLIEGNLPPPASTPAALIPSGAPEEPSTSSPEFFGVPETPGKSLLAILSADLESSPAKVIADQQRKELESAVYSILPTPIKLLSRCPLLSPLHNTPINIEKPRHIASNKTPEVETTSPEPTPAPPPVLVESAPTPHQSTSVNSTAGDETLKISARQSPNTSKPSFPFKRRRVLKIKCTTSNNSSLGENSSMEEPPAKKACEPLVQLPMPSLFSPPKEPEPRSQKVPSAFELKKTAAPKNIKSSVNIKAACTKSNTEKSPSQKIVTPKKQMTTPASVSSTGRKSNDSVASQDFRLHYTSDSEVSRSPSPYLPQNMVMTTSTPHPSKNRVRIATDVKISSLTPNSKKKQKRKIISEMFGASPASEREYHLDLDVTEELMRDLHPSQPKSKAPPGPSKKNVPVDDISRNQRSKIEFEEKSRPTADRISKYKPVSPPDYYRKRSPDRRRSPLDERRKSPEERERRRSPPERRRSPPERRWSPEERERRRSPDERFRKRSPDERGRRQYMDERSRRKSPVDRDRKFSPDDRDNKRRYVDERRRSPDERDRKYMSSRSPDRNSHQSSSRSGHYSSRRRSPGSANTSFRRSPGPAITSSRRSPSPRDRRAYRDPSLSPARDEDRRRYKRVSRSISPPPKLNGSSRYKDLSPRRQSPARRGYDERGERSHQRSANSTLERRDEDRRGGRELRGDSDEGDVRVSRRQAPVRDLRNIIGKSRSKSQEVRKRHVPIEEPPSELSEEEGSEEGELESD